jgi:hypothetical protein
LAFKFKEYGNALTKEVPYEIKNADPDSLRAFIRGFEMGDGKTSSEQRLLYTASKNLADDLQEIANRCGYAATLHKENCKTWKNPMYVVSLLKRYGREPVIFKKHWYKQKYEGKVYCVKIGEGEGNLFVRRNGISVWCMNTYKILQQSTIRKWLELAPSWLGEYKEQKSIYELKGGKGLIYIRSTDDPLGLEGMTLKAAWLDEAGQMSDDTWRIIQGRLSILHGRMLVTTTPYTFNWVYDLTSGKEKNDDLLVVHWESIDSPWFPKTEYLRQQKLAEGDPSLMADFEKRYKGIFRRMSGRVYGNWHEKYIRDEVGEQYFKEFIGGIDWGYTQPAAVEIIGFSDNKPGCVVVDEWYESGRVIDEVAANCIALMKKWNVRLFYADPSRPDYIQDLNKIGRAHV